MRIESIQFKNYKLLRDATLPLEPLTVIVGPNGSGKSTVIDALSDVAEITRVVPTILRAEHTRPLLDRRRTVGTVPERDPVEVRVRARFGGAPIEALWSTGLGSAHETISNASTRGGQIVPPELASSEGARQ